MLICSFAFSILAAKYEKVNGVVDYVEATCGPRYGYLYRLVYGDDGLLSLYDQCGNLGGRTLHQRASGL